MRTALLSAVALVALVVAIPGVSATTPRPKAMVLTVRDLPTGFKNDRGSGYRSTAAAATENSATVDQYQAWGFVNEYEVGFTRHASLDDVTNRGGATNITSSITTYRAASGAEKSLASRAKKCRIAPSHELPVGAKIGGEAHLCGIHDVFTAQVYVVIWRHGSFTAAVAVAGLSSGVSPAQAVRLALRQDRRMR